MCKILLADCLKPLILLDFSKSYNFTPTIPSGHIAFEHVVDHSVFICPHMASCAAE